MTLVAVLHLLAAASGLFLFVGMSAVVGERGFDPISGFRIIFGAGWAFIWGLTGIGVLRRWLPAWYLSISLVCVSFLVLVLTAIKNPLGVICHGGLYVGIVSILIVRRGEFR